MINFSLVYGHYHRFPRDNRCLNKCFHDEDDANPMLLMYLITLHVLILIITIRKNKKDKIPLNKKKAKYR